MIFTRVTEIHEKCHAIGAIATLGGFASLLGNVRANAEDCRRPQPESFDGLAQADINAGQKLSPKTAVFGDACKYRQLSDSVRRILRVEKNRTENRSRPATSAGAGAFAFGHC
jgi:hypothetical protein